MAKQNLKFFMNYSFFLWKATEIILTAEHGKTNHLVKVTTFQVFSTACTEHVKLFWITLAFESVGEKHSTLILARRYIFLGYWLHLKENLTLAVLGIAVSFSSCSLKTMYLGAGGGGGTYLAYTGMCRWTGYVFQGLEAFQTVRRLAMSGLHLQYQ